jgi:indole-3-glycerol phosphate synthase
VSGLPSVLERILEHKRGEVSARKRECSEEQLYARLGTAPPLRNFAGALHPPDGRSPPRVIAEIKRASPSAGVIRADFDPPGLARAYAAGGAAALSVLTDAPFFGGADEYLGAARQAVALPVLRKDFTIDPYQVLEARILGADCVLLIVAALDDATLRACLERARELGLAALVEVHDGAELERALKAGADLVGVNNRDLHTFETRLETSEELALEIPEGVTLVAESGLHSRADLRRLSAAGISAFLIGESLMRQPDPGAALADLLRAE